MKINDITKQIIDAGMKIHTALGPGLFESVYESILSFELAERGLSFERQVPIPVLWKTLLLDHGFRADLIVEESVIIELKSVEKVIPIHKKQVLTYLRVTGLKVGLLLNFGAPLFRDGIERIINGNLDEE